MKNRQLDHESAAQMIEKAMDAVQETTVGMHVIDCPIRGIREPTRPKKLSIVSFWNCGLEQFDWNIQQWGKLQFLLLSGTFDGVPETLRQVPESLRSITIQGGSFRALPQWVVDSWKNLRVLWVIEAQLLEFPAQLEQLPNIEVVGLQFNNISKIPEWLTLKRLDMTGNRVDSIPEALKNATVLSMGSNRIPLEGLPWSVPEILERNIRLRGNPACEDPRIANTPVCTDGCSDSCSSIYLQRPHCYSCCNTTECNFHNRHCVP